MRIPKYQVIKNELKKQLASGQFADGDKFYTEAELSKLYNVSSITVIRALNDLVKDGYLSRQQGRGTFVSRTRASRAMALSEIKTVAQLATKTCVHSLTKDNQAAYLDKLGLAATDHYYKVVRLKEIDGQTIYYQEAYIPAIYIKSHEPNDYVNLIKRFQEDVDIYLNDLAFNEIWEMTADKPAAVTQHIKLKASEPIHLSKKTFKRDNGDDIVLYAESYTHWKYFNVELIANAQ